MCGFCVTAGFDRSRSDRSAIESVLDRRGPDGRGEWEAGDQWMLHKRLAIIDPHASAQPMHLDDSQLVYNGEIYNYEQLACDESGDTAVFGRALSDKRLADLHGMYAGVIRKRDGSMVIARDRFGIKPLYYRNQLDGFAVASQLRCFEYLSPRPAINPDGIASYLRFGSVVGTTMFRGVDEARPGSTLERSATGDLRTVGRLSNPSPADLAHALEDSVRRHLVSDVPVALLLSGGLDSAIIAALASRSSRPPTAVCLSVDDSTNEADRARRTADHYGLDLIIDRTSEIDIRSEIDGFFDAMDQPTIDGLNTYLVTSAVRRAGFKVALSGLGADELFGGYKVYRRAYFGHLLRHLPGAAIAPLMARSQVNQAKTERWLGARSDMAGLAGVSRELFAPAEIERMTGTTFEPAPLSPLDGLDAIMQSELTRYMQPMLLRDADAFSMARSVEMRVPFLDDAVVGAALRRSAHERATKGKRSIAEALQDEYLTAVSRESKTGFTLPFGRWINGDLSEPLARALEGGSPLSKHVDVAEATTLADTPSRQWALITLNEWLGRHDRT